MGVSALTLGPVNLPPRLSQLCEIIIAQTPMCYFIRLSDFEQTNVRLGIKSEHLFGIYAMVVLDRKEA